MNIRRTDAFLRDYRALPIEIRERVEKLKGTDKFEIRISKGYRLTLRFDKEHLELRRVGTHDILREEG